MKDPISLEELRAENSALRERIDELLAERSERENASAKAAAQHARMLRVLAELPLIVDVYDISTRRSTFKNRELDPLLGYPLGALAAMGPQPMLYKTVHPDDIPRMLEWFNRMLDVNDPTETVTIDYRFRRADGTLGWFRSHLDPFDREADGRIVLGLMVTYDISETKAAEAELRALNAELDKLVAVRTALLAQANEELQREVALRTALAAQAEERARVIRALGAPVIRVHEDVLAVPVIGTLDQERAQLLTEALLGAISNIGVQFCILDLTSVGEIDGATVEHIQRLIAAIGLLGTKVVICGISANVARRMIEQGLTTESVTLKNLREALIHCRRKRG